jgi:hypothetical protein
MSRVEKKKNRQAQESPQQITRREFAIGSMAILGANALAGAAPLPPLSAEAQAMKLEITQELRSFLEVRHILDDDLKRVIDHAERTGEKLFEHGSERFLSKLRAKDVYFYVEYSLAKEGYQVHTAYTHRFLLAGDP